MKDTQQPAQRGRGRCCPAPTSRSTLLRDGKEQTVDRPARRERRLETAEATTDAAPVPDPGTGFGLSVEPLTRDTRAAARRGHRRPAAGDHRRRAVEPRGGRGASGGRRHRRSGRRKGHDSRRAAVGLTKAATHAGAAARPPRRGDGLPDRRRAIRNAPCPHRRQCPAVRGRSPSPSSPVPCRTVPNDTLVAGSGAKTGSRCKVYMTHIGKGIVVTGTIEAEESVSIGGTVKGEILATAPRHHARAGRTDRRERHGDDHQCERHVRRRDHRAAGRPAAADGMGQSRNRRAIHRHGRRRHIQRLGGAGAGRGGAPRRRLSPEGIALRTLTPSTPASVDSGPLARVPTAAFVAAAAILIAAAAAVLLWMGRVPICKCGYVKLWHGVVLSSENSQHLSDWYTFSHIIHGFAVLRRPVARRAALAAGARLLAALVVEGGWEIFENTPVRDQSVSRSHDLPRLLRRQRDQLRLRHAGDGARISAGVATEGVHRSSRSTLALELFVGWAIRDNLTLNILMLVHPSETVKQWQSRKGD